jgi:hypothetical protein
MNNNRYLVFVVLISCFLINGFAATSVQAEDLTPLLNKISKRMNAYPENNNIQYKIVKKYTEMDKKWRPKKTTATKTIRKVIDGISSSEVLEAVITEEGETKDIKQGTIERIKKQDERKNKKRAEQKDQNKIENPFDEFFPFHKSKRTSYEFKRHNDDIYHGRPVFIIEAVSKEKDENLNEGKYYIDQKTYDVLKARVKPSKKPKIVKEADMEIDFQVLPEGNFMIKRMKARVDAGLLFMRMRAIQEEEYFDVKILD